LAIPAQSPMPASDARPPRHNFPPGRDSTPNYCARQPVQARSSPPLCNVRLLQQCGPGLPRRVPCYFVLWHAWDLIELPLHNVQWPRLTYSAFAAPSLNYNVPSTIEGFSPVYRATKLPGSNILRIAVEPADLKRP